MRETGNEHNDLKNEDQKPETYQLKLFIAGASMNSVRSIKNMNEFCQKFLHNRFELEIIDIYQQPSLAEKEQIIALPVLIRKQPLPEKRFVGDMSNIKVLLNGLEITNTEEL